MCKYIIFTIISCLLICKIRSESMDTCSQYDGPLELIAQKYVQNPGTETCQYNYILNFKSTEQIACVNATDYGSDGVVGITDGGPGYTRVSLKLETRGKGLNYRVDIYARAHNNRKVPYYGY